MTDEITRINDLRQRVRLGETLTKEEMAEALRLLRADRERRLGSADSKKKAAAKPVVDLNDLFKED